MLVLHHDMGSSLTGSGFMPEPGRAGGAASGSALTVTFPQVPLLRPGGPDSELRLEVCILVPIFSGW